MKKKTKIEIDPSWRIHSLGKLISSSACDAYGAYTCEKFDTIHRHATTSIEMKINFIYRLGFAFSLR